MPKPLIAIISCHRYRNRMDDQRASWLRDIKGIEYRFFLGQPDDDSKPNVPPNIPPNIPPDEVWLDCEDGYKSLPAKIQAVCRWAIDNGYTHLFKLDDDAYCFPDRLLTSGFEAWDFIGSVRAASGDYPDDQRYPHSYPSGGSGYWLSLRAMRIIATAAPNGDWAEDRFIGNILGNAEIKCRHDDRYRVIAPGRVWINERSMPQRSPITLCMHPPAKLSLMDIHMSKDNYITAQTTSRYIDRFSSQHLKVLVAVVSCHKNVTQRKAIRETWAQGKYEADVLFFIGRPVTPTEDDCIYLDCDDSYERLTDKVRVMIRWAVGQGYDFIFKCDDDTYVSMPKLMESKFEIYDYTGFARPQYCQGGAGYWLSAKSMRLLAGHMEPNPDQMEDRWVGMTLNSHGVTRIHDDRYCPAQDRCPKLMKRNALITAHKLTPDMMRKQHNIYINS